MNPEQAWCIRVFGIVQGVGFRPFVSRIADAGHLGGTVCNKGPYVEIQVQGTVAELEQFQYNLVHHPPERSAILKIQTELMETKTDRGSFAIVESAKERGDIFVSPDIAICPQCKAELFDKNNRRYHHPFINCTACGPRLTILDSMPYDRERTSMGEFPMCPACTYEYTHAETRRYDAQPVCCNDCGPQVYLLDRTERGRDAIAAARRVITEGGIVAVKGIGGFHLCCDGTREEAVQRLRRLKKRPVKPFAVMIKSLIAVERECLVSPAEEEVLDGHQKPIILLEKKKGGRLCPSIAPGNPKAGVMLPYAPLQLLLFTYDDGLDMTDCLVMTSANESGAPICRTDDEARQELTELCDLILSHDRKIRLRADDSVMDFYEDKPYMIRRSRGYAPLPCMLSERYTGEVLGIGGELKNTFCPGRGNLFYPSPYIGDMTDLRTVKALKESVERLESLLEISPSLVACDLHPRYNTTILAQTLGLPVLPVQHHYAHIVSCMADNDYRQPVIGVSFDGTGYGTDGTIWGGEFLLADYKGFTRLGAIRPFWQRGGDISAKEGWRIAVSILYSLYGDKDKTRKAVMDFALCDEASLQAQLFMADHHINSLLSTSAGRLFDGISAILGICRSSSFEGEASMALEFAAMRYERQHSAVSVIDTRIMDFVRAADSPFYIQTDVLTAAIIEAALHGSDADELAYAFHAGLADLIIKACQEASRQSGIRTVALSGGVFQNQLLLRLCTVGLRAQGFDILTHSLIPPNDGGIALGQAVIAMEYIQKNI